MTHEEALAAYAKEAAKEREKYLDQQTLKQAGSVTRGMNDAERERYLRSQTFLNTQYQARRRDKVYQALTRGELIQDYHRAEFEQLEPLILSELKHGGAVDLPFLRSVARSRLPLGKAHAALRRLDQRAPRRFFQTQLKALSQQAEHKVERFLERGDFSDLVSAETPPAKVVPYVMERTFRNGVPDELIERAFLPQGLTLALQEELYRAYPELSDCRNICLPSGEKLSAALRPEIHRAKYALFAEVRRVFPLKRIRRLLSGNASLRRLQSRTDMQRRQERAVHTALLEAIPEHYKDLYPAARQMRRRFVLHLGPTNSGKTHESIRRLRGAWRGIYLGPLRLLAAEQFDTLNQDDIPCSLVTGEEQIRVPNARIQSSTVEMADLKTHYDVAVIDECQMVADRERGGAWTAAILGLCADEIHLCASPDAEALLTRMIRDCGDDLTVVRHERMTPLMMQQGVFHFPASVRPGDALIVFSKARVHAVAAELRREGYHVSLIYGALPPDVRRDQAERFRQGDHEVVVSTDAIAMGMNLPIRRVVFLESEKFDGDITRTLTDAEFKQIAGRAGRFGIYDCGYVNALGFKSLVAQALEKPLPPLTEAVIRFPESLLGLPLRLSDIIRQWTAMKDRDFFSKAATQRMAYLTSLLETGKSDKQLVYRFVCIPFDEAETELLDRWKAMYRAECRGEHLDVLAEAPALVDPEECGIQMLDGLEADYRRCDLYYNYARLFLEEPEEQLAELQHRKDLISQGIIHILSTQKLPEKRCASCGRRLEWNWPYRLCDACHERQGRFRRKA